MTDSEPGEPLGLGSGVVEVVPYDARWRDEFAKTERELREALGPSVLAVHHVGSTAVPALCAKPVLDVLASVADFERAVDLVPRIESLGYEYRPDEDIPDRHYFRRRRGMASTHHLSLAEPTSTHHRVTIAFRDALRADAALAKRYCELKLELARRFPRDRGSYIAGKTAFVAEVLARSRAT